MAVKTIMRTLVVDHLSNLQPAARSVYSQMHALVNLIESQPVPDRQGVSFAERMEAAERNTFRALERDRTRGYRTPDESMVRNQYILDVHDSAQRQTFDYKAMARNLMNKADHNLSTASPERLSGEIDFYGGIGMQALVNCATKLGVPYRSIQNVLNKNTASTKLQHKNSSNYSPNNVPDIVKEEITEKAPIKSHNESLTTYAFDASTKYNIPGQTFEMTGNGLRSIVSKWDSRVIDIKTNSIENVKCDISRASYDPNAKAYDEVTLKFEGHKHGECESSPIYQRMIGENLGAHGASMAPELGIPLNKGEEVFRLDTDTSAFSMQTIVKNPDDGSYYSISCHDIDKIRDLQDKGELGNTIEKALNTNPRYAVKLTGENLPAFLGTTPAEVEPPSPSDKLTGLFNNQQPDTFNAEASINKMPAPAEPTIKMEQTYNPVV